MEQRISFVTLAVRDVDRSRSFYVNGLGWSPELDVPGEVLMFMVGEHMVYSLWDRAEFEAEVGTPAPRGLRRGADDAVAQRGDPGWRCATCSHSPRRRARP